jgi:hypothetical protein
MVAGGLSTDHPSGARSDPSPLRPAGLGPGTVPGVDAQAAPRQPAPIGTLHALLAGQSLLVVLLSINRLSTLTLGYALPNEGLRWVDLTNMLVWPFLSVALSYGTLRWIERGRSSAGWHGLLLLLSVYLLAAGYGNHEVTNYLNQRFCAAGAAAAPERLCAIVRYNDDDFSHLVFFAGFIGVNLALMLAQAAHPRPGALPGRDLALLAANAACVALAVFANLAFEDTGLDLPVVVLVALLAAWLLWRARQRGQSVPLVVYSLVAYGPSAAAVALAKLAGLSA